MTHITLIQTSSNPIERSTPDSLLTGTKQTRPLVPQTALHSTLCECLFKGSKPTESQASRNTHTWFAKRGSVLHFSTINRRSICHVLRICPLIPPIHRGNTPRTMGNRSLLHDAHRCKSNILPATLSRTRRPSSTNPRLPRRILQMKYCIFRGINNVFLLTILFYFHPVGSIGRTTTYPNSLTHAHFSRVKTDSPITNTQLSRNTTNVPSPFCN